MAARDGQKSRAVIGIIHPHRKGLKRHGDGYAFHADRKTKTGSAERERQVEGGSSCGA